MGGKICSLILKGFNGINMRRKTHEEFISEVKKNSPEIEILGQYINYNTKVKARCTKCGYIWLSNPGSVGKGHGCPKCANNIRKSTNQFKTEMGEYNPYIMVLDEYKNANTPLLVRCRICGNEWKAKPARLLTGAQCMNCVKPHTSFMEQFILATFKYVLGEERVKARDTSAIGLELDIYIPEYNLAIEPGSWLYHKSKVNGIDLEKRKKCQEKGIRLITIYDTYPKENESPYKEDCYVFDGFLNEYGYARIKKLVKDLLMIIGNTADSVNWTVIANTAYESCHYNAHETFAAQLKEKCPSIELLENYKGSNIPILVNDSMCNHPAWKARPYTLLKGIGCPECGKQKAAKNKVKTQEQFEEEVKQSNPRIKVLGKYTRVIDRIRVECVDCGYSWEPLGYSLIQGKGCPHCSAIIGAKKRNGLRAAKTTEQFVAELKTINDSLEVLGEYKNNKTKIKTRCLRCGHEWEVVAASLLNGHGCPKCSRKNRKPT
ncbi:MAG: hypothetical protein K6G43_05365 [Lachnospiraceae bacterium]|nr:hypothetical protein [Lachnospiraceae bacterium]